jgi:hypothetical protein
MGDINYGNEGDGDGSFLDFFGLQGWKRLLASINGHFTGRVFGWIAAGTAAITQGCQSMPNPGNCKDYS